MGVQELHDPLKALAEICTPDRRQRFFTATLQGIHRDLSEMALNAAVPSEVRQLFETAKNISLYSWFVYPFHQVAELVAFSALEFALRIRAGIPDDAERPPTLGPLLTMARLKGWFPSEAFAERRRAMGANLAHSRKVHETLRTRGSDHDGAGFIEVPEPTEEEVAAAIASVDVLSALVDHAPWLRNKLAHGSKILHPNSRDTLGFVREAINALFCSEPKAESSAI